MERKIGATVSRSPEEGTKTDADDSPIEVIELDVGNRDKGRRDVGDEIVRRRKKTDDMKMITMSTTIQAPAKNCARTMPHVDGTGFDH